MAASGDWVTPRLNGLKYFEKPPLQYWATAAAYSIFGERAWTSRLWAAALGFLCLPLVFVFASKIGYSRDVATIATSILAINPFFMIVGQVNLLDQAFSFLLVAAVFAFVLGATKRGGAGRIARLDARHLGLARARGTQQGNRRAGAAGRRARHLPVADTRACSRCDSCYLRAGLPLFALIVAPWFCSYSNAIPSSRGSSSCTSTSLAF